MNSILENETIWLRLMNNHKNLEIKMLNKEVEPKAKPNDENPTNNVKVKPNDMEIETHINTMALKMKCEEPKDMHLDHKLLKNNETMRDDTRDMNKENIVNKSMNMKPK